MMIDSIFIDSIIKAKEAGRVISVFCNINEPDKCSVGFVENYSNNQIIIKHINPYGLKDGYIVRRMDDIFRLDSDGSYEQKIFKLYSAQKQTHVKIKVNKRSDEDNLFLAILQNAMKQNRIINVCIDESEAQESIIGFVKKIDEIGVIIQQIDEDGTMGCESVFFLNDIIKINYDTNDEHILWILSKDNHREIEGSNDSVGV